MSSGPGAGNTPPTPPGRFPRDRQLDNSLEIVDKEICRRAKAGTSQPNNGTPTLPGYPTRYLRKTPNDIKELENFICHEFMTPKLNRMAPKLWLLTTTDHANISPLHEDLVRGRKIIVTENPELHLTWIDDQVFIKPVPPYLTSHAFWQYYLDSDQLSPFQAQIEDLLPAILGYLRSWTYLVRHESDFILAKQANLIPRGASYTNFVRFLSSFDAQSIQDSEVSPRYLYGQMRLSRLNFWAKILLRQDYFEQVYWQYWQYFQTFYAPLLFVFAVFTVVLSAMQVGMTSPDIWPEFRDVSVWFSVLTLLVVAIVAVLLVVLLLYKSLKELFFAIGSLGKKGKKRKKP